MAKAAVVAEGGVLGLGRLLMLMNQAKVRGKMGVPQRGRLMLDLMLEVLVVRVWLVAVAVPQVGKAGEAVQEVKELLVGVGSVL